MNEGQDGSSAGIRFAMQRGPFQNNGASPWYASLGIGTPPQSMKFALDSGTNIVWTTSTLCAPDRCQHYGGSRFDDAQSSTFRFIDQTPVSYSFGPWGTMMVESGSDVLGTPDGASLQVDFYLSQDYGGPQFAGIDWDGGLGIPSGTEFVQPGNSFIVEQMMNSGAIDPMYPYVSFYWNGETKSGNCIIGGYDTSEFDPYNGLFVPWDKYPAFDGGVGYIWSTPMQSYAVGDEVIVTADPQNPYWFCLDSGSSQFKGDDYIMDQTLQRVGLNHKGPPIIIQLGPIGGATAGTITVDRSMYNAVIEAGVGKGALIAQFAPLNLPGLALVGSTMMEHCYTMFTYQVSGTAGSYTLAPAGMWLFNKPNGPKVITLGTTETWVGGPRPVGPPTDRPTPVRTTNVRPGHAKQGESK